MSAFVRRAAVRPYFGHPKMSFCPEGVDNARARTIQPQYSNSLRLYLHTNSWLRLLRRIDSKTCSVSISMSVTITQIPMDQITSLAVQQIVLAIVKYIHKNESRTFGLCLNVGQTQPKPSLCQPGSMSLQQYAAITCTDWCWDFESSRCFIRIYLCNL